MFTYDYTRKCYVAPEPKRCRNRIEQDKLIQMLSSRMYSKNTSFRPGYGEYDLSQNCERPKVVELLGEPTRNRIDGWAVSDKSKPFYTVLLRVKCRKCISCLKHRSREWAGRAAQEIQGSVRTWFATFTLSPHNAYMLGLRADSRLRAAGVDPGILSTKEKLEELRREFGSELTKWVKRLRKGGAVIRYYLTFEHHKSGMPHAHALIHELDPDAPVRHATLTSNWDLGYTKFKLVSDHRAGWYVSKYLTKEAGLRVRASCRYGRSIVPDNQVAAGIGKRSAAVTIPSLWPPPRTGTEVFKSIQKEKTFFFGEFEVNPYDVPIGCTVNTIGDAFDVEAETTIRRTQATYAGGLQRGQIKTADGRVWPSVDAYKRIRTLARIISTTQRSDPY